MSKISTKILTFTLFVSVIASSLNRGWKLEVDSYIKHKMFNINLSQIWFQNQMIYLILYLFT